LVDLKALLITVQIALGIYSPFDKAIDYFVNITKQHLDLIADKQIYHDNTRDVFLYYVTLRENAHRLVDNDEDIHKFFLKQIGAQGNIIGIIYWQFARFVPTPSYFTADLDALYSSWADITEDDKMLSQEFREERCTEACFLHVNK
jgi:hypothetical protein